MRSSRPALHNADNAVKWQFMRIATFAVNGSEHECDILLSPAVRHITVTGSATYYCNRQCDILLSPAVRHITVTGSATYYCHRQCDILLSPAQRLRPSSTSCNVPRECKIIRTYDVESFWMRRSNGAMQPSALSAARRYTFQNKSDFRRGASFFHSDWRDKSYASHVSQILQSAIETPSCHMTTAIQTHSINHTYPLPTP
jgi:hypothetical protein